MKNPTPYLKMRVLGAIDMAEGHCIQARIKQVAATTFTDEDGHAVTGHLKTSHLRSLKTQPPENTESKEHFFSNKLHISR